MRLEHLEDRAVMAAGPGGIGNTVGTSDLGAWLTPSSTGVAANTPVTVWSDLSGYGNNATAVNGPVGNAAGQPAGVTLNGSTQYLDFGANSALNLGLTNSDYEMLFVATSSSGAIQFLVGGDYENYEIHLNGVGARYIPDAPFNTTISSDIGSNGQYTNGATRIFDATLFGAAVGTQAVMSVDGTASADNGIDDGAHGSNGLQSASTGNLRLGRRADNSFFFNGTISEVIIFSRALSAPERVSVNNYLQAKYGTFLNVNDQYSGDLPGNGNFDFDVFGVGATAGQSLATNSSGGLTLTAIGNTIADGQWVFAGNNGALTGFDAGTTLSARKYYVESTAGLNANMQFDLATLGLPALAAGESYRLVSASTPGGPYTQVPGAVVTVSGGVARANGQTLTNGYYALQRVAAPVITTLTVTPSPVNEKGVATLAGTFTDSDANEAHTLFINWGDGNTETQALPAGQLTFSFTHTYTDDNPTGTSSDVNNVSVRLSDASSIALSGVLSYWNFDEAASGTGTAFDQVGPNNGTFVGVPNTTRAAGLAGVGSLSMNNNNGGVSVGTMPNFAGSSPGLTIEALIQPQWSGSGGDYDEIFRKNDALVLLSFQNDGNGGGATPPVAAGPVLSFGAIIGGYGELDMPLNVNLAGISGGNANSGTIYLNPSDAPPVLGPNDVVLKDGATHHVAATYDSSTGQKSIWIDGIRRFTATYGIGTPVNYGGGATGYIGSSDTGEPWTGRIDEVAIYNVGLSAAQVAARASNALAGSNQFGVAGGAASVTVNNVAPANLTVASVTGGSAEGQLLTYTFNFQDPGLSFDTYSATVNFGDGSPPTIVSSGSFFVVDAPTNTMGFIVQHVFSDNATFNGTVTITDDDLGNSGPLAFASPISNAPPSFLGSLSSQFLTEGQSFTQASFQFNDPGTADTHTATIDFGDGTSPQPVTVIETPSSTGSTSGTTGTLVFPSHTYADEGLTNSYTVTLILNDDNGATIAQTVTVFVSNANPVVNAGGPATLNEGQSLVRGGSVTDPGTLDTFPTATVDYGDGSGVQPLTIVGNSFSLNHVYAQNGSFTVTVIVNDNDGGAGSGTFLVTVNNVAPVVDAGAATGAVTEGVAFTRAGSYSDAGVNDTHTAIVNYGDGSGNQVLTLTPGAPGTGTFALNHTYADNGTFTITVTVTDNAGDVGTDTIVVTVGNAAPVVAPFTLAPANEGFTVNLSTTFTDGGTGDTHTALINWGDGTTSPGVIVESNGSGTVTGTHVYADNQTYTVTVTVTDDDLQASAPVGTTIVVANQVPLPGPVTNNQPADEGSLTTFIFPNFNDRGTLDTHQAFVNWGDSAAILPLTVTETPFGPPGSLAGMTGTLSGAHLYDDNGTYTVTVYVRDDDMAPNTAVSTTFTVIVANVAPDVVDIQGPQEVTPGLPVDYTFYASDPSAADLAAGFTFHIDWDGDGIVDEDATSNPGENFVTVNHIFPDLGDFTIIATAEDKDGDIGAEFQLPVSVVPVIQIGDDVYVGGTQNSDTVAFSLLRGGVRVLFNGVPYGPFSITSDMNVIAYMQDGNDKVTVGSNLNVPFEIHGGLGNDYIAGGPAADSLYGDEGTDTLIGGNENDLLDGGDDADKMDGGNGNDIMLGGEGNDSMTAGAGNDSLDGGGGIDKMNGGLGNDVLRGGEGNDTMNGDGGNDILLGNAGNDSVVGGDGHDVLIGGDGADRMEGGNGDDLLLAGNSSEADTGDDAALLAIVTAWAANKNSAQPLLGTVTNDSSVDILYGKAGIDWFYATASEVKDFVANNEKRF